MDRKFVEHHPYGKYYIDKKITKSPKEIKSIILKHVKKFSFLDNTGKTYGYWKEVLDKASDKEIRDLADDLKTGQQKIYFFFDNDKSESLAAVKSKVKANKINLPFVEKLEIIDANGDLVKEKKSAMIGVATTRVLKQRVDKKTTSTLSKEPIRNPATGQLTKTSATASTTYPEINSILTRDLTDTAKELCQYKADDINRLNMLRKSIIENGRVSGQEIADEIPGDSRSRDSTYAHLVASCKIPVTNGEVVMLHNVSEYNEKRKKIRDKINN